jgi:glyoxylase-like metal-dependent hydrolase (beta-lactamase superfamily II)
MALLFRDKILFAGDHLWGDGDGLDASSGVCWYSWSEQTRSMERLLDYDFEWVLPGHGPPLHASPSRMRTALERLIARMKR